jgi:ANTAR domain
LAVEDLGSEAAELLSLTGIGEARSLNKLAELAVKQVPGCSGAYATVWRDRELISMAATHPDTADLTDLQLKLGRGPLITAAYDGVSVSCPDTLTETRWPEWAADALRRGVRCSVDLVRKFPPMTLVLSLFGVRPALLDAEAAPIAQTLTAFGSAMLANTMAYGEAQRTATQLKDSVAARAITDQAKGVLMHALGCDAEDALKHLRRESQRRHVKVTQVAAEVIAAYGGQDSGTLPA